LVLEPEQASAMVLEPEQASAMVLEGVLEPEQGLVKKLDWQDLACKGVQIGEQGAGFSGTKVMQLVV
jgi:hypothetical protein